MPEHHRAARLRHWITIKSAVDSRDASGGLTKTYSQYAQDWADLSYLRGRELEAAQKINSEIEASFLMRFRSDLTVKMKIDSDGIVWNIHSIIPDDRDFYMMLYASQVK